VHFVKDCDYRMYHFCVELLIPDVLDALQPPLVHHIRTLAKNAEHWLRNAMQHAPDSVRAPKQLILATFATTLRRYTSLNHLAQNVRNSLQNDELLRQMLSDINKVDFAYIRTQVKWTCSGCDEPLIARFEREFKDSLRSYAPNSDTSTPPRHNPLERWMHWLDTLATSYLQPYVAAQDGAQYAEQARHFLLKWSFMCSAVIRDLTLRSAHTFGSFHLIRLLYDEYMCYLVEQKIATEYKQTPIAVMNMFDFAMPLQPQERSQQQQSSLVDAAVSDSGVAIFMKDHELQHESSHQQHTDQHAEPILPSQTANLTTNETMPSTDSAPTLTTTPTTANDTAEPSAAL
jgi:hypothetical protein